MTAIPLGADYSGAQATYPHAPRAASSRAYLVLLRMEVTAFHRNLIRSSLWPYSSPYIAAFGGRPLTVILLYGARTFLPPTHYAMASGCLACFTAPLYRRAVRERGSARIAYRRCPYILLQDMLTSVASVADARSHSIQRRRQQKKRSVARASGCRQTSDAAARQPVDSGAWRDTAAEARRRTRRMAGGPPVFRGQSAALNLWPVVQTLQARLPADTILTNGAGNFATWAHRFWRYAGFRTQLAPTSGAMDYGVPAGIAASIISSRQTAHRLAFAGDGDFMMNGQELTTAVQYSAGVLFIVFNNNMYGTIRMHQERISARESGTELHTQTSRRWRRALSVRACPYQRQRPACADRAAL